MRAALSVRRGKYVTRARICAPRLAEFVHYPLSIYGLATLAAQGLKTASPKAGESVINMQEYDRMQTDKHAVSRLNSNT